MFSLLFGLWRYLFSKAEYHILILGIDKAGKTVSMGNERGIPGQARKGSTLPDQRQQEMRSNGNPLRCIGAQSAGQAQFCWCM